MDLLALADFNLVAAHGGFGRASRASGRSKTTLSRRVAELEAALGARLIERGAGSLRLTEEGAALHARTEGPLGEIAAAGAAVGEHAEQPRGRLRVSAPVLFSHAFLGRIAAAFAARHPAVQLEITAEDRLVDPVEEGVDVVIRINPASDHRLVGRCFLRNEQLLVAAPALAAVEPVPDRNDAPIRAVLRAASQAEAPWRIRLDGGRLLTLLPTPALKLSSLLMMRDAVLAGAGYALLPDMITLDDLAAKRLVCCGVAEARRTEMWVLHTSRRLVSAKVRAFLRCLEEEFRS